MKRAIRSKKRVTTGMTTKTKNWKIRERRPSGMNRLQVERVGEKRKRKIVTMTRRMIQMIRMMRTGNQAKKTMISIAWTAKASTKSRMVLPNRRRPKEIWQSWITPLISFPFTPVIQKMSLKQPAPTGRLRAPACLKRKRVRFNRNLGRYLSSGLKVKDNLVKWTRCKMKTNQKMTSKKSPSSIKVLKRARVRSKEMSKVSTYHQVSSIFLIIISEMGRIQTK